MSQHYGMIFFCSTSDIKAQFFLTKMSGSRSSNTVSAEDKPPGSAIAIQITDGTGFLQYSYIFPKLHTNFIAVSSHTLLGKQ